MKRPALFLDRDGVINVDYGYVHKPDNFHFIPGIFELVKHANRADWRVVIVTNQAGIAKGYYSLQQYRQLETWLLDQFRQQGAQIDAIYHCPHHPEHGEPDTRECDCRKPMPGMFLQAAAALDIDMSASILVGDKTSDLDAAKSAGVTTGYLVMPGQETDVFKQVNALLASRTGIA